MAIRVIRMGWQLSVQDSGRKGYRRYGVPVAGAMDQMAAMTANLLCGNDRNAAVLELVMHGAKLACDSTTLVCFTGSGADIFVDQVQVPLYRPLVLPAGCVIDLRYAVAGCRTYMAIAGGIDTPTLMGSRSFSPVLGMIAITAGEVIRTGVMSALALKIMERIGEHGFRIASFGIRAPKQMEEIRFTRGVEWDWFTDETLERWRTASFQISSRSNRMGYILQGVPLSSKKNTQLISSAVLPGTVQITPEGSALLLMADAQTTGGYPRIAQIIAADLSACAQRRPGESIRFREVSAEQSRALYLAHYQFIHELQHSIRINFS